MALSSSNVFIANSTYTCIIDSDTYCTGFADIFDVKANKSDIMFELLDQINEGNDGLKYKEGLVAIFDSHKGNNENSRYFRVFKGVDGYSEEDYINHGVQCGFGFITIRVI